MVKLKHPNNIWKPLEIDGNLLNSGVEGLIGIEECTDYNLDVFKNKKHNKRKSEEINLIRSESKEDKLTTKKRTSKKESEEKKVATNTKKIKNCESTSPKLTKNYNSNDILTPSKEGSTVEPNLDDIDIDANIENVEAWSMYGLPRSLLQALSDQGFTEPTEIQALTLPAAILGRRDILGAAETGSGKTLAFGLPIIAGILKIKELEESSNTENVNSDSDASDFEEREEDVDELDNGGIGCVRSIDNVQLENNTGKIKEQKPLYSLILTPTRELAVQIKNHLTAAAKYTGINIAVVVGGMAAVKQERILSKGPEIVVATPGRLWDLIQLGNPHLSQIDNIRFLAIDETDRMLERGHFQELHNLLERLNLDETRRKLRQNFVFSATLTLVHDIPKHLKNKAKLKRSRKLHEMTPEQKLQKIVNLLGITDPKVVDVTKSTGTSGTLTECRITCAIDEKDYYVYYFLQKHPGRTLIFCNSIGCVRRLTTLLGLLECNPLPLHASMQQRQRLKNLERFRDNTNAILVATDVAARGLDIPGVEHVLHYQTPRTSEGYVHRSGRTARATQQGITVLLMEPTEIHNYIKLCKTLGKEDLPLFPIQDNFLNAVKLRVNLARDLDKVQLHVKKTNSEVGWFQKAAEEMDIIIEDRSMKHEIKEASQNKKVADLKRKQLSSLLAKPIFPKGFSGKFAFSCGEFNNLFMSNEQKEEKALDVMKTAMENYAKDKKKRIPLYKFSKDTPKKNEHGVIKLNKFKNGRGKKNKFKSKNRN